MASITTELSLPEELFASLESLARRAGSTNSAVIAELIKERAERARSDDQLTRQIDDVLASLSDADLVEQGNWLQHSTAAWAKLLDDDLDTEGNPVAPG